jgi:preprotein translocase subunit Sss1
LDYVAWDFILETMTNAKELKKKLKEAQRLEQQAKQPARDELSLVQEHIKETESEIDEIALALRKAKGRVAVSLEKQQTDVNARYARYCRKREELQAEIDANVLTDEEIENTVQFQKDVAAGLKKPTWDDKRYYFEMLQFKAVITGRKAKLSCRLRVGVKEVDLDKIDLITL